MPSNLAYIQATERLAGAGGGYTDTLNRALRNVLSGSGYDPDATTFPGLNGPVFNVKAFGAVGTGIVDDRAKIALADAAAIAAGNAILFPSGTYLVSASLAIASPVIMAPGAIVRPAAGVTVTFNGAFDAPLARIVDQSLAGFIAFGTVTAIYPQWFGAKGDGISDDTAALNAAFAIANASVVVPAGNYKVLSNLNDPACAAIIGAGRGPDGATRFLPGPGVTQFLGLYALPIPGPTLLQNFWIDGSATTNATGIKCGDTLTHNVWTGLFSNVRVSHFTGATGLGIRYADSLKAQFEYVQCNYNTMGMLCQTFGGSLPTYTAFHRCQFANNTTKGIKLITGEVIVFDGCLFESNGEEGVLLDTSSGTSITNVLFKNGCWFEDNWGANAAQYQFKAFGPAGTCRFRLSDAFFSGGAGTAKAVLIDGVSCAGYHLDNVQVPNVAAEIRVQNSAYGRIDRPANAAETTISDTTNFRAGYAPGQIKFPETPSLSTDAHTLDWYEEGGVFAPTLGGDSVGITYTTQLGSWTRIGRLVTVQIRIVVAAVTTPSGALTIEGLPALASAGAKGAISVQPHGLAAGVALVVGSVVPSTTHIALFKFAAGALANMGTDLRAGSDLQVTATYEVA